MQIGELAQAAGTQTETIRFYEREGLLPPAARNAANYRVYEATHVQRLAFIRHCRSLDMTLDEIRVLLRFKDAPGAPCTEVAHRLRELRVLQKELRRLRKQCSSSQAAADCGILSGLEHAAGLPVAAASAPPTTCGVGVLGLGTHRSKGRKDSVP